MEEEIMEEEIMEDESRLLQPSDVDRWRKVAGECAVCEIGKGSIRHRQLEGKFSSATQYPVGENVARRYSVSEHYPRGNKFPSCHRASDWIHFPFLDGRRAYNSYSRSSNPEIDRVLQATPVGGRGDTFRQRGCPSGTLGSRWSSYIHWNFGPP